MGFFTRLWQNEPVAIMNALRATFLAAGLFGFSMTETQLFALMSALELWLTLFSRQQVTTNTKVKKMENEILRQIEESI